MNTRRIRIFKDITGLLLPGTMNPAKKAGYVGEIGNVKEGSSAPELTPNIGSQEWIWNRIREGQEVGRNVTLIDLAVPFK